MNIRQKTRAARQKAFTLIEVMVVVVIIGVLLNIAMPNLIRARESARAKACVQNLKRIDSAKEQYALDNKLPINAPAPAMSSLAGSGTYLKSTPICPSTGVYAINPLGTAPTCSVGNNVANSPYDDHVMP